MAENNGKRDFVVAAAFIATLAVLVGLGRNPYSYYMGLRLGLCALSLLLLTLPKLEDWQRYALGAAAILYNPLIPIRLGDKDSWIVLNFATLALFWVTVYNDRTSTK